MRKMVFVLSVGLCCLVVATVCAVSAGAETVEEMKARMGFDKTWPSDTATHEFVGVKKCALCHKAAKIGNQYGIWHDSAHADAYNVLATPEAKAIAAPLKIDNPQESPKCLRCHATAYFFGEEKVTDAVLVEEGISCETCHGPGKGYMKLKVMKDRDAAVAAGLAIPDKQVCLRCHNSNAPTDIPFDYDRSWAKIRHPLVK